MNKTSNKTQHVRAPLKWPGGKYKLLDRVYKTLTPGKRLIEPFAGSCVVSLNAPYQRFLINDKNTDVINFYKCIKNDKNEFIEYAKKYFNEKYNNKDEYYFLRDEFNSTTDIIYKSAILLYISRHGYNGLLRYNLSGQVNVPMGQYKKPYFPEKEMQKFIQLSKKSSFQNKDFELIMRKAEKGDVVYCDPPYVPLSTTANFTTYSSGGFNNHDQERLVRVAEEISAKGVNVLISNHATSYTRKLYSNAQRSEFLVRRMISCNGKNRNNVREILASYPARGATK
ncbi:MAG: Dam family site-specific DNA-(adenine-N6)-methyltransferase [Gammaproteobacteria bacterium]|nr:Dam family site-specific DNA-(adenine-N6)-methyltransferase [Gammaproteobacteria bacterium]MCW9030576.1 Dam family site-specific DNA-(adenine-N6)-methyltransferase [Gammaproteobacteria bacterium]